MKILWLSHIVPYPPKAGLLLRAYNMIKELSQEHEIDLIAFNQKNLMNTYFKDIEQGLAESKKVLSQYCNILDIVDIESDKSTTHKILLALKSLVTKDPYTINWLKSKTYAQAVSKAIQDQSYDIVHFDTISLHPFKHLVGQSHTILDHHNVESDLLLRRATIETNVLKKFYYRQEGNRLQTYEKSVCPEYSLNITCSKLDTERFNQFIDNIEMVDIPNGVDIDFFKPEHGSDANNKSLIFAGTLDWYPNKLAVEFLVHEIWPALCKKESDIHLYIVGSNPATDLVEFANKNSNITVTGFVDDVRPYIDSASVYVCPIKDGGGTKLKILDALAMGKAIVADPIAVEGIDITHTHDGYLASSVEEYVSAISRLLHDKTERRKLETNARILAENKYAYSMLGKNLRNLYSNLVNK
ncbi:MAG: glycosyltransferase family 4 protein [Gammaproteobacteria bacterium]|nr:glycosyltransferase family 4 protein [Gammaproteobacteria bacterium]